MAASVNVSELGNKWNREVAESDYHIVKDDEELGYPGSEPEEELEVQESTAEEWIAGAEQEYRSDFANWLRNRHPRKFSKFFQEVQSVELNSPVYVPPSPSLEYNSDSEEVPIPITVVRPTPPEECVAVQEARAEAERVLLPVATEQERRQYVQEYIDFVERDIVEQVELDVEAYRDQSPEETWSTTSGEEEDREDSSDDLSDYEENSTVYSPSHRERTDTPYP